MGVNSIAMKYIALFSLITCLAAFTTGDNPPVKDYFKVPGPLAFNKETYRLAWSAHPSATYYKQEYLPAGQTNAKYKSMILLEVATGNFSLADVVKAKTNELDQRKKTDPLTNYAAIRNPTTGDHLIDFVVSQGTGAASIVEYNVYRYISLKAAKGTEGVLLVGYSKRAYGAAGTAFLQQIKTDRPGYITAMANYSVPAVKL